MLDHVIKWSLQHRAVVLFAATVLFAASVWAAISTPVDVFPDLTAPTVTVMTEAHGLAAEEVETLVTFPIETAVNGAAGVRRVRSSSSQGFSIVWVEFDWDAEIFRARQIVSEKLQLVTEQLPEHVDAPVLAPITSIMGEIMFVGMHSDRHTYMEVRSAADWIVRQRLLSIEGISQVIPMGGDVKQYQVRVNPEALRAYRVSLQEVLEAAAGSSENASGGVLQEGGREILIRGIGLARTVEDIAQTVVAIRGGTPVLLRDVAEVAIGPAPRIGLGAINGEPAVVLSILKQPNANTLTLTDRIDDELAAIQAQLPEGMLIDPNLMRQADFISIAVANMMEALWSGALLVVVILLLFLWSLRTAGISVLAIPLSLSFTFLVVKLFGVTINTMTLGGMAISIGALVDDAIIDVENVFRRLKENRLLAPDIRRSSLSIVYDASKEVRGPILNATLIIAIVFLPLFFLSGVEGRMLRPLGFAYIVSILGSLVVAMTTTPVLCYYLLPGSKLLKQEKSSWLVERLQKIYSKTLGLVLARTRLVLVAGLVLLAATVAAFPFLGRGFLPEFQEGALTVTAITAPGTGLETSGDIGRRIEHILLRHSAVAATSRRTGRAELDEHSQGSNGAEIEVRLDLSAYTFKQALEDLRADLAVVPGVNITIGQPIGHRIDHMLSGTRASIAIKLFGPELQDLRRIAEQIRATIENVPGVVDLSVEQQADVPQLRIYANRPAMARYGVTSAQLAEAVDVAFGGETVSEIREGQEKYPLVVRFDENSRGNAEQIGDALFDTPLGPKVTLSELAEILPFRGPNAISREDVQRKIVISSNVAGRDVGTVVDEIRLKISQNIDLPDGYSVTYGGQFESAGQATRRIALLSIFSIALIFLILYQAFSSVRAALLVMVNLPLALTGGLIALFLFAGGELNVAALVGFITLFGIAVRNGILLVSHYLNLLKEGKSLHESVFQGSMERLNPILMTALTAGLALLPLAFGGGEPGKELQTPMAIVILGGLLTSTFLNMVVVPALFLRFGRKVALRTEDQELM